MTKNERKQIETINTFLKDSKVVMEKIRKSEAEKFINTPVGFVRKGGEFDTNATILADTLLFFDDCIEHLDEIVDNKG